MIRNCFLRGNEGERAEVFFRLFFVFIIMLLPVLPQSGVVLASDPPSSVKASELSESPAAPTDRGALPGGATVSERIFGLPGLSKVGRVAPGVYRGGQPEGEGYATLKEIGIRTVINLRSKHSERDEVTAAGMYSVEFPMTVFEDVDPEKVKEILAVMTEPANQPVYIHCKLGQDRTGVIVAAYRVEVDGWPLSHAEKEMQAFGFNDFWYKLKRYLRRYGNGKKVEDPKDFE